MKCYTTRGLKNLPGTNVTSRPIIEDPKLFIEAMYKRARMSRMKKKEINYKLDYPKCREMATHMQQELEKIRPPPNDDDL